MQTPKTQKCIVCTTAEELDIRDKRAIYRTLICTCVEDAKEEIIFENGSNDQASVSQIGICSELCALVTRTLSKIQNWLRAKDGCGKEELSTLF
jgi:hypothetical protein